MKILMGILGIVVVGLLFLGILYNFITPFVPDWFAVTLGVAIALAFLVAHAVTRGKNEQHGSEK